MPRDRRAAAEPHVEPPALRRLGRGRDLVARGVRAVPQHLAARCAYCVVTVFHSITSSHSIPSLCARRSAAPRRSTCVLWSRRVIVRSFHHTLRRVMMMHYYLTFLPFHHSACSGVPEHLSRLPPRARSSSEWPSEWSSGWSSLSSLSLWSPPFPLGRRRRARSARRGREREREGGGTRGRRETEGRRAGQPMAFDAEPTPLLSPPPPALSRRATARF